ncbi:sugar phosphate nucleotidyltransferase [Thauera humireducens]|uniref:sugar phosphate nucleotidyltransferase n=1 Tax=Thauera humireducens TaxID=1134435 RepID=UPI00311E089E
MDINRSAESRMLARRTGPGAGRGRGSRLRDLTNVRAKPAVHFGGKFRIIDFLPCPTA